MQRPIALARSTSLALALEAAAVRAIPLNFVREEHGVSRTPQAIGASAGGRPKSEGASSVPAGTSSRCMVRLAVRSEA